MKRGDLVVVLGRSGAITKARPCVVVQRGSTLAGAVKITACPLSGTVMDDRPLRPIVMPTDENGLRKTIQVEVDWIFTEAIDRFGPRLGTLDAATMGLVDAALRLWLDL